MGSQHSQKHKEEALSSYSGYFQARNKYQTKLFLKKKKTNEQFKNMLQSIYKRSTYLKYKWAAELCAVIQQQSADKLYFDYQKILKQNCSRQGRNQKPFCPSKIRHLFLQTFKENYGKDPQLYTSKDINEAFEECKCYFMVIAWTHQLVTINNAESKENGNPAQLSFQCESNEEEIIYQILSHLIMHDITVHVSLQKAFNATKILDQKELIKCLKLFKHKLVFREKEMVISGIMKRLEAMGEEDYQNMVHSIVKSLGIPQSYTLIKIIKEIGTINVEKLWKIIKLYRKSESICQ